MSAPVPPHDLGSGFTLTFWVGLPGMGTDSVPLADLRAAYEAGTHCGVLLWRGEDIIGAAPLRAPSGPTWTVQAWDPLTLTPSLLCQPANVHGWIRQGQWVHA